MTRPKRPASEFIKAYEKNISLIEVAKQLGITYGTAKTLSWRYRKAGLITTNKRKKNVAQ